MTASPDIQQPVQSRGPRMNIHFSMVPIVSLICGVLILVMPKLLNYIIALYLIAVGLIGIFGLGHLHIN
jgi:hypothetical protein